MRIFDIALPIMLFFGSQAEARNQYFATFVPMSLQNLGYSSANTWVGNCANCHNTAAGGQVGVPDLNMRFGRDFYAFVANTGTDFTQPQVQAIIQGIETLDSDGDGAANLLEYRGRTNPNDPLSVPASQGDGGNEEDPSDYFPDNGSLSGTRIQSSDELYSLSGCGGSSAQNLATVSFEAGPFPYAVTGSVFGLWFLPVVILLFMRKRRARQS